MSSVLKVTNLTKDFGGLRAVDNISFDVGKGEFKAFAGLGSGAWGLCAVALWPWC